jgi:hypothetical protein
MVDFTCFKLVHQFNVKNVFVLIKKCYEYIMRLFKKIEMNIMNIK